MVAKETTLRNHPVSEVECNDDCTEAACVVNRDPEPNAEAGEPEIHRASGIQRSDHEVQGQHEGKQSLHVMKAGSAVVNVPSGDGQHPSCHHCYPNAEHTAGHEVEQQDC